MALQDPSCSKTMLFYSKESKRATVQSQDPVVKSTVDNC